MSAVEQPGVEPPALPPGPFSYQITAGPDEHFGARHVYILDRNGRKIASIWGKPGEKLALADLIIRASGGTP